jgi:hypothetical protein
MTNPPYSLRITVDAYSLPDLIKTFEGLVGDLRENNYQSTAVAGGGGGGVSFSVTLACPKPEPLTDAELVKIRKILKL